MVRDEKTLADVLHDVWRGRYYLLFFGVLGVLLAFLFVSFAMPSYRAEMIIGPARGFGQAERQAGEGSFPVRAGFKNDDAFLRFLHTYYAPSVAGDLMTEESVQLALSVDRLFSFFPRRGTLEPHYLKRHVRVDSVSDTPFYRMVYYHPDPKFAVNFVRLIHQRTDERIRGVVLLETNERIDYLNGALMRAVNPEHRRSLAALLMEQERVKMMLSLDQPFAARVIEPAFVSMKPKWPDKSVVFPVFLFVGLLIGFVVHGLRSHG